MADRSSRRRGRQAPTDPLAEAEFLRARLRAREVDPRTLQLWSYFDHEPARLALDDQAYARPEELTAWLVGLGRWGSEPIWRSAQALARRALPLVREAAPDLASSAEEIVELLGPVARDAGGAARLRQLKVPLWSRASELRRQGDSPASSKVDSLILVERAGLTVLSLQTGQLKKSIEDLEWLGRSALALPGWADQPLLEEICEEVLPSLVAPDPKPGP